MMEEALSNGLILEKILYYCSNPKTCRLVCHDWNCIILRLKRPKLIFQVTGRKSDTRNNYLCCSPTSSEQILHTSTLQVLRSIRLCHSCVAERKMELEHEELLQEDEESGGRRHSEENACQTMALVVPTLVHTPEYSNTLQILKLYVDHGQARDALNLLKKHCLNLQELKIVINRVSLASEGLKEWNLGSGPERFSPRDGLRALTFSMLFRDEGGILDMMGNLLGAARNLEILKIYNVNWYPDFGVLRGLKILKIKAFVNNRYNNSPRILLGFPRFKYKELVRMLDQVKESLEVLVLGKYMLDYIDSPEKYGILDWDFPKMLKLKTLIISEPKLYPSLPSTLNWRNLAENLVHLKLRTREKDIKEFLEEAVEIKDLGPKLKSLWICGLKYGKLLSGLKVPFPQLLKLEYILSPDACESCIKYCRSLGLQHLEVSFSETWKMLGIMEDLFLCSDELFGKLRIFKIRNLSDKLVYDDLREAGIRDCDDSECYVKILKDVLLTTKMSGLQRLEFTKFSFEAVTAFEVFTLIKEHALPVIFRSS